MVKRYNKGIGDKLYKIRVQRGKVIKLKVQKKYSDAF